MCGRGVGEFGRVRWMGVEVGVGNAVGEGLRVRVNAQGGDRVCVRGVLNHEKTKPGPWAHSAAQHLPTPQVGRSEGVLQGDRMRGA